VLLVGCGAKIDSMSSFLKFCMVTLALANVAVAGFQSCHSDEFLEERLATTEIVLESISVIFSSSNNTNSTTGAGNLMGLYVEISATYNATVITNGFVEFLATINEISATVFDACSAPEDYRPETDDNCNV